MGTSHDLNGAQWRKSSYSGSSGGECVECTVTGSAAWRKSSYSGSTGGDCVEVADGCPAAVPVRDSKNPAGPVLILGADAWRSFISSL
ncbi:DUF397 domain-containing protein [Streptomyces sp. NPDC006475]|uniref:DUF397 domain-containing protein n=1 Tax=Streptomyces sp. NPDC006475 TaxID=3155719 RepID=UPI0033B5D830